MTRPDALFIPDGDLFVPTVRTQGPWAVGFQFGGAPAALIAHVVDRLPSLVPQMVARLTVDLLRPVPMTPLEVVTNVRREGKRLQVIDVSVRSDGVEVVAATAMRLRIGDLSGLDLPTGERQQGPPAVPIHEHTRLPTIAVEGMRGTLEYAVAPGHDLFDDPYWARLTVPVVEGHTLTSLERMAYVADSCSGVGHPLDAPVTGINADLMLRVIRPCVGDWLRVDGHGFTSDLGVGMAQVTLSDELGVVGGVSISRLVDRL